MNKTEWMNKTKQINKIGWIDETKWTKLWWTSDIRRNCDGCRMKLRRMSNETKWNETDNDDATEQSTSPNFVAMACKGKERIFFLYFMFYYYYYFILFCLLLLLLLLLLKLRQGLLARWLQAQKHTWVHSPDANLKTHVQGKQMYVGLHHLVQILYCNQTLCVWCMCSQNRKLAIKQALKLFTPSSL
jgi:hypothetical protein